MYINRMGNLKTRVNEIMDKIYNSNGPSNATELEEELAKKLKENFADSYKKAANDLVDPENENANTVEPPALTIKPAAPESPPEPLFTVAPSTLNWKPPMSSDEL